MPGEVVRHNQQIHKEVLGGKLYWKRSFLSFYLDHDRNLLCFCRTKFNRVINMHSTCQKRVWKKTERDVERNFFEFGRKVSAGFVTTSIHMFMRTVWTEKFFETISIFKNIRILSGKKLGFCQNWFGRVVKLHSTCPLEKHGDKYLGWIFFRTLNKNSSV